MVKRDSSYLRSERLKRISQKIAQGLAAKDSPGQVPCRGLGLWIQYEIGLTESRAEEYIALVVAVHEGWTLKDGYIKQNSQGQGSPELSQ